MNRILFILALAITLSAHAETLTFVSAGPDYVYDPTAEQNVYIYPYYFQVNGSPALVSMMCISYAQQIWQGESWQVNVVPLTTPAQNEAAWLLTNAQEHPADAAIDQWAAWYLFDPAVPMDAGALAQLAAAEAGHGDGAGYALFVPISGTQSEGGLPQTFIGITATSEPPSLALLLSGLALMWWRRKIAWHIHRKPIP